MPKTIHAKQAIQNALYQAAALGAPATGYVGLLGAETWQASQVITSTQVTNGFYAVPTTFNSMSTQVGRIFKCTTAGTTSATEPTWPTTEGGTVADGTAVWTEVTLLFAAGTFTGAELGSTNYSAPGYARTSVTANSTNWSSATSAEPCVTLNAQAINFSAPSGTWAQAVGWIYADASTSGNIWEWAPLNSVVVAGVGSNPSFAVNAYTSELGTSTLP